jgi:hypothetical protein
MLANQGAWITLIKTTSAAKKRNTDLWLPVKLAFGECKIVDPYFNKTMNIHGEKDMATHWGIIQVACH